MKDRAMQTLQLLALQPIEETLADENSYGFRMYRGCHDAMQKIFTVLAGKNGAEWILEGDIKGCFDNISHDWLIKNIPMNQNVLKQFIVLNCSCLAMVEGKKNIEKSKNLIYNRLCNRKLQKYCIGGFFDDKRRIIEEDEGLYENDKFFALLIYELVLERASASATSGLHRQKNCLLKILHLNQSMMSDHQMKILLKFYVCM